MRWAIALMYGAVKNQLSLPTDKDALEIDMVVINSSSTLVGWPSSGRSEEFGVEDKILVFLRLAAHTCIGRDFVFCRSNIYAW